MFRSHEGESIEAFKVRFRRMRKNLCMIFARIIGERFLQKLVLNHITLRRPQVSYSANPSDRRENMMTAQRTPGLSSLLDDKDV